MLACREPFGINSSMPGLVSPHGGGGLRPLQLEKSRAAETRQRAQTFARLRVTSREKGDLIMLGIGGFTPLDGFMTHADWQGVCDDMRTANGLFWPIPITLSADERRRIRSSSATEIALIDPDR